MTNWFTQNGKVLTNNGKIRGCCCDGPDDPDDPVEDLSEDPFEWYDPVTHLSHTFQFDYAMYEFDLDLIGYGSYHALSINQKLTCDGLFTCDNLFEAPAGKRDLGGRIGRFKLKKWRNRVCLENALLPGRYFNWYLRTPTDSVRCPPKFEDGRWWNLYYYASRDVSWAPHYARTNDIKFFYNYAFSDDILTLDPYISEDFSAFNNIEITGQIQTLSSEYFKVAPYLTSPFGAGIRPPLYIYVAPQVKMTGDFLTLPYVTAFDPLPVAEGISTAPLSSKAFLEGHFWS